VGFEVGSLVRARGREWVVLPESEKDMLIVRPLGGMQDEVTGIYLPLESVEEAHFQLPTPRDAGDYRSCRLLRDALRLGFRSSAGPFRSFGRINVDPRPYQLVPLLMALKMSTIRMLISDDVGIGKTIEACLVARELIDQGDARRMAVLCPPHLAEQWQAELREKFHIDAELVLAATAGQLERRCGPNESLFDLYPNVIVSIEFIKADRRRDEFIRACPDLVIVDEAHGCALGAEHGRQLRHELVKGLAADRDRHLILVTATPHSGKPEAFRSLISLLDPVFEQLPDDLAGPENQQHRSRLSRHFVQRRRADIRGYLHADTPFPDRDASEETYQLSPEYRELFKKALDYTRESVTSHSGDRRRQRVRWWSALALLRSLASSPAAAAATLRARAIADETRSADEADELGRRTVLDLTVEDSIEGIDLVPGSTFADGGDAKGYDRRRLLEMARAADALVGEHDAKLEKLVVIVKRLLADNYRPIVFCRFIPTANYVGANLRRALGSDVEVVAVTGEVPPAERKQRVALLTESSRRVLVATDCLSEGINLQDHFDAVVHYDLSWNPTRHEQREGRVDRYGQPTKTVKVITYYGVDNQIDGIVLEVLIRKHRAISASLGISVPVPQDTQEVVEALFEGLLLRRMSGGVHEQLKMFEEFIGPKRDEFYKRWDAAAQRERRSRSLFAQQSIKVEEVARELSEVRVAIGAGADVETFAVNALRTYGGTVTDGDPVHIDLRAAPNALREALGSLSTFTARFQLPVKDDQLHLSRTHPVVEGLASYVLDDALDPLGEGLARRAGVIRTKAVQHRTNLLLLRYRFHLLRRSQQEEEALLAEDCQLLAWVGSVNEAHWLSKESTDALLLAIPDEQVPKKEAEAIIAELLGDVGRLNTKLEDEGQRLGEKLLDAHKRIRAAAQVRDLTFEVRPHVPPDVLGVYVYVPAGQGV
jgi:superfamily II DNA or RNA helicase